MNIREQLKDKKRIVVKVGSSSLTHRETGRLDLNKMEVLISPKMSEGNRILLDTLIKRYNPTALLKESVLRGKM